MDIPAGEPIMPNDGLADEIREFDREELAVIRKVRFGMDDRFNEYLCLSFTVYMKSGAAGQAILGEEKIKAMLKPQGVEDISTLEGRTCVVERRDGLVFFKRLSGL